MGRGGMEVGGGREERVEGGKREGGEGGKREGGEGGKREGDRREGMKVGRMGLVG